MWSPADFVNLKIIESVYHRSRRNAMLLDTRIGKIRAQRLKPSGYPRFRCRSILGGFDFAQPPRTLCAAPIPCACLTDSPHYQQKNAVDFTNNFGDIDEPFYNVLTNHFENATEVIALYSDMCEEFMLQLEKLVDK